MITIVDYGMGNIGSLQNMIHRAGGESRTDSTPEGIASATKLLLPGVGAFDNAMTLLTSLHLVDILNRKVLVEKVPTLCICLGAQLITEGSEEGNEPGLGWIKGKTVRFRFENGARLKVPHMGWNEIQIKKENKLFNGMHDDPCFYFVHSYHLVCDEPRDILSTSVYGYEFVSAIQRENIFATQFHPEKSHKYGLKVIGNFLEI